MTINLSEFITSAKFSAVQRTSLVNANPKPANKIATIGLFKSRGVRTRNIYIERLNDNIAQLGFSEPGGPGTARTVNERDRVMLSLLFLKERHTMVYEQLQDVLSLEDDQALEAVEEQVNRRSKLVSNDVDNAIEMMRLNALRGLIVDMRSGEGVVDLRAEFGFTDPGVTNLGLTAANQKKGNLNAVIDQQIEDITDEMDGLDFSGIGMILGRQAARDIQTHPDYRQLYENTPDAIRLAQQVGTGVFQFGGVQAWVYDKKINKVPVVGPTEILLYPLGVQDDFYVEVYGPTDFNPFINGLGQPKYERVWENADKTAAFIETSSRPMAYVGRPNAVRRCTSQ